MINSDQPNAKHYPEKAGQKDGDSKEEVEAVSGHGGCEGDPAIAIVGMGIRLSGGISSPDEFWRFLIEGRSGLSEVPSTRYRISSFHAPGKQKCVKTRHGYFLQQDPTLFDADFFGITAKEAGKMDPQQRLLLETTAECLEDAGETQLRGANVGCYIGVFGEDWLSLASQDPQSTDRYHVSSTGHFALSNRISYQFDWHGPSMTIQTACSSSMVSLHEACQALLRNDCSAALVGGVNLILNPTMTMAMSDSKVLAADGACKTFDASADGYGRGEGISVILIKRLEDAIKNNDTIRAVIRATNTNFDGKTPSISAPDVYKQESLIRSTYARAGISKIDGTAFFECHGTGTQVGDLVEVTAVARVLQDKHKSGEPTWIGSVKPNVGHTEGASGLTSIIKATLCLENDMIPPNIFFKDPNPNIPFGDANLLVPCEPTPFPAGRTKRVSVNSFGVGGSNGHAILESASAFLGRAAGRCRNIMQVTPSNGRYLIVLSAKHAEALERRISDIANYTNQNEQCDLKNLSYTLCCRREHLAHRAFAVLNPGRPLARADFRASYVKPRSKPEMVWLFTGQGAQWAGMAQKLVADSVEFRSDMENLDDMLKKLPDAPAWSIKEELAKPASGSSRVNDSEIAQPLSTAIAIGLINQFRRWGVCPSAVVGHSSGELAAAYASGALPASSAIIMAYYRGLVSKMRDGDGAMATIGLGRAEVQPFLRHVTTVGVACENSPRSTVLSGNASDLTKVIERIKAKHPQVFCRKLRVAVAYHSSHLQTAATEYERLVSGAIVPSSNMVPMYSTVSLNKITNPADLDPAYWSRGLTSPVQFSQAIENVMSDFSESQLILLEIGAHSTFAGFIKQIVESTGVDEVRCPVYVPTLTRNDPDASAQLLAVAGRLHSIGVEIDMPSVTGVQSVECNLPSYPWDHHLYRSESRLARDWRLRAAPHHELLGSRVPAMPDQEPTWRNIIRMGDVLWLGDHVLDGKVIFPAAGYIAIAGAACTQLHSESVSYTVRNLVLTSFLTFLPGQQLELLTTFKKQKYNDLMESDWYNFSVSSYDGTGWTKHCNGEVRAEYYGNTTEELGGQAILPSYSRRVNTDKWYKAIRKFGYEYGQRFRGLENVSADPVQIAATGTIEETSSDQKEDPMYFIHPTVIDCCLQMMGVARAHGLSRRINFMEIPGSVESVFIARNGLKTAVNIQGIDGANQKLSWNAVAVSGGREVLSVRNLRSVVMNRRLNKALPVPPLTNVRWVPLLDLLTNHEPLLSAKSPFSSTESQHPWSTFLTRLAHSQPSLRILEIGSGTADITRSNLEHLKTREGTRLFSSYTLTGMSAVSLDQPKLELDDIPGVNFKVYNVRDDLESQGLEAHSFELVLMTATTRLLSPESLTNVRELLAPGGWVLVQNAVLSDGAPSNTSNGDTSAGDASSLRNGFEAAGLECVEDFVDNDAVNGHGVSKLTLLAKTAVKEQEPSKTVTLLTGDDYGCVATDTIAHELAKRDCSTKRTTLNTPPHPGQFIISVLDFGSAPFHSLSRDSFTLLKRYLLHSEAKHVLWITKATQTYCHDPRYGLVHGFVRTLRQECGLNLSILEVDELDAGSAKLASTLQTWIEQNIDSVSRKLDAEFAILNGQLQVARYHWVSEPPRLRSRSLAVESALRLHLDTSLSSQSCSWVRSTNSVLAENQVEVDIQYVGLNFRDILVATGLIGNKDELGIEASGIITRVGHGVHGFEVGDKVGVLGPGLCQTRINVLDSCCWKFPRHLSLQAAASALVPFLTALYSLIHVGNLRKGQSVLIHSACGGVGLAAMQVCQMLEAKVYATVGSNDKIEYLTKHFSLPRKRIFSSRDESFVADLMKETDGRGVDIVLNSLAGKLLHSSWDCVATFGKMLELGKIDFNNNGILSMSNFAKNRAFIGIDLLQLASERPEILSSLMNEVCGYLEDGKLTPLPVQGIFDASKASDALKQMQAGQHIGKFLLRIPRDKSELRLSTDLPETSLRSDASYILVGGTGGIGRAVANWMAERGATELIFLTRISRPASGDEDFVRELATQGCSATFVTGSVTDLESVRHAVDACSQPIRGVLQLSATLRDRTFVNMTYEEWTECLAPKVTGTWNLHEALQDHPDLDFFVLFGSLAGVYGNSGQANYAAANTYLESFVHYRRNLGLPCSLLNLGPVEDIGMLSRDEKLLQSMKAASVHLLCEADICKGLGIAISQSPVMETEATGQDALPAYSCPAIVNMGMSLNKDAAELSSRAAWAEDARFALFANLESNWVSKPTIVDDKFRAFMAQVEANPAILNQPTTELIVCREIARLMTGYLSNGEVISDEDIGNIAIDSLMAIEIKDWVRGNMNLDVSMDQTSRARTSGELASHVMDRLKVKYNLIEL